MHSPRLQPPSPPQKSQTELELPSGSCWILQERAFTYKHDGIGDEVAQDLMPRFHCPLSLPFKMHHATMFCPPHNLGTERGHESCVWPPSPRQTEALPASAHWQPAYGQLLPAVMRPLLHFRSRAEFCTLCSRGPGRAPGLWDASAPRRKLSQQLEGSVSVSGHSFPSQEGNARLLHIILSNQNTLRLEINSGKTGSYSVHSPLDQRIKRNNGVSTQQKGRIFHFNLCLCLLWNLVQVTCEIFCCL